MSKIEDKGQLKDPTNVPGMPAKYSEKKVEETVASPSRVKESKGSDVDPKNKPLQSRDVKANTVYARLNEAVKDRSTKTKISASLLERGQVKKNALENLLTALKQGVITPQDAQSVLNEFKEELITQAPKNIMFSLFTMENLSAGERFEIAQIFEDTLTKNGEVIHFQEWTCFQLMRVKNENPTIDHEQLIKVFNSLKTGILTTEDDFTEALSEQIKNLINGNQFDLDDFWAKMMEGFASTKTTLDTTLGDIAKFKELVGGQIGEHFVEAFKKTRTEDVKAKKEVEDDVNRILESDEFQNLLTAFIEDYIKGTKPQEIMMFLMPEKTDVFSEILLQKFEEKSLAVITGSTQKNFKPKTDFDKAFVKLCSSYEKILSKKEVTKETIKSLMTKIKEAFNQGKLMGIAISVIAAIVALALLGAAVITWPVALSIFGGTVIAFFLYGFIKGLAGRSIEKDLERIEKVQTGVLSVAKLLVPDIETKAQDFIKNAPQKIVEEGTKLQKKDSQPLVEA
jgi:hypothetical protein